MTNKVLLTLFALFFCIACAERGKPAEEANGSVLDSTNLVTVKYSVEGMTCTGCENTVNYAVGELEGVAEVTSSHQEKYTLVTYDSGLITEEEIEQAITGKGYTFLGLYEEE
ncbi:MAG: cation transporter [Bacteroidales bacterium]